MHKTVQNLISIQGLIKSKLLDLNNKENIPKIIAVSKTFKIDHIKPLIEYGHLDYGENKVQEALEKWKDIKIQNNKIKLHLIGKLQTNKVKFAVKIFDYIHSLDSKKLAKKISEEQEKQKKKPKIFIQINVGDEDQKSGIAKADLIEFYNFSKNLGLDIIGLMCIPPFNEDSSKFFSKMSTFNKEINLKELSMGMSSDYINAIEHQSTYLRIGSNIFGKRA
jgi:pyridoxal phosphate enzyme (YggS family)